MNNTFGNGLITIAFFVFALSQDLEKSYSVQKTLVESQKATEMESMELQEFMQAEKSTLTDSLRDTELEVGAR